MQQSCYVLAESACDNAALTSVCAHGRDGGGHAANGPSRTLDWSRVSGSRIKRPPLVGFPHAADRSRCGSSSAGKRPQRATEAAQAVASHASSDSPRMLVVASQRSTARKTCHSGCGQATTACSRGHTSGGLARQQRQPPHASSRIHAVNDTQNVPQRLRASDHSVQQRPHKRRPRTPAATAPTC
ncbi:hypothetical protein BHM03_00031104 [Ensete ventricosum]|uniref:Uncharacterized protein n=1 Tax=Ensete ventricosum TaxID=4639 RepID=A0A445MIK0_ENSVE|nr:hypothetical protein BHM03_00031104 [Ensete ventricosum]